MADDNDLDLFGSDEPLDGDDEGDASDDGDGGESGGEDQTEKRLKDLQSRLDKETARANKAEKALQAKPGDAGERPGGGTNDPDRAAWEAELLEDRRDAIYAAHPELKEFGIDRSLIDGRTRDQMRASAAALVSLVKSVEAKTRNKVMKDFGLKAEPAGTSRSAPKDYASMSDEDFEKEMALARAGGVKPLW